MTTSRFRSPWNVAVAAILNAGLIGGFAVVAIEFYFGGGRYVSPSAGRNTELVTSHGAHLWVSNVIWWIYKAGEISFFASLACGAVLVALWDFDRK